MSLLSMPNASADWDHFDSNWYCDHNYLKLRDDDHQIIMRVRDFFAANAPHNPKDVQGVDVGSGANLYPALTMLPFCDRIDLREYSASNVAWLESEIKDYSERWDAFWQVLEERDVYGAVADPRIMLAQRAKVTKASVFDLPLAGWDIGTMFFVACSLSTEMLEYRQAVASFLRSLRAGAPFAAAFMVKSTGYPVDGMWFPAVPIDQDVVSDTLASLAYNVQVDRIETGDPLRDGYGGAMLIATGRAAGTT